MFADDNVEGNWEGKITNRRFGLQIMQTIEWRVPAKLILAYEKAGFMLKDHKQFLQWLVEIY